MKGRWRGLSRVSKSVLATVPLAGLYLAFAGATNWWPFEQPPDLRIDVAASRFNPAGPDDPRDEYVCLVNDGDDSVSLTGWLLRNSHGDVTAVPSYRLGARQGVRVHPGTGDNSAADLFGTRDSPQWSNSGGSVTVVDDDGRVIDSRAYGPVKEQGGAESRCGAG